MVLDYGLISKINYPTKESVNYDYEENYANYGENP